VKCLYDSSGPTNSLYYKRKKVKEYIPLHLLEKSDKKKIVINIVVGYIEANHKVMMMAYR